MNTTLYMLVYEGFELLDMAGPVSVFSTANHLANKALYDIKVISTQGGFVAASCGLPIDTQKATPSEMSLKDTFLVAGAPATPLGMAIKDKHLVDLVKTASKTAGRIASVCSGSFLLAQAGLLESKPCTTHWIAGKALQKLAPEAFVDCDALYIEQGKLWTSAGVTTGIDMALAMLEKDQGKKLMGEVARHLVVFSHRPGKQSQFSQYLEHQLRVSAPLTECLHWINSHLHLPIRNAQLADIANMSERSFYRRFCDEVGLTPAKYIEQQKMQKAKALLAEGSRVHAVQLALGYRSESAFRTVFEKVFGVTPQTFKQLHSN